MPARAWNPLSLLFGGGLKATYKKTQNDINEIKNDMSLIKEIQFNINQQFSAMMDVVMNLEINITNDMKAQVAALAAANLEVKGMIGSVDASLKQNQQVGSGVLSNVTNDPKMVIAVFIILGIVIVVLVVSNAVTLIASMKKDEIVKNTATKFVETETRAKDYKKGYYETAQKLDNLITALAKNPEVTLDIKSKE